MRDEARETSRKERSTWDKKSKLRYQPVPFASAGTFRPSEPKSELVESEQRELDDQDDNSISMKHPLVLQPARPSPLDLEPGRQAAAKETEDIIDSDEEVLVFRGRGRGQDGLRCVPVVKRRELGMAKAC